MILGSNSTFLFIGFPSERVGDDWSRYDYDYFQSELAAAKGVHLHTLCDTPGQSACVSLFNINSAVSVQHQRGYRYALSAVSKLNCVSIGSLQPNPSLLAAFYDYIKLMPMVTEANQMSQELNKVMNSINSELIISPSALSLYPLIKNLSHQRNPMIGLNLLWLRPLSSIFTCELLYLLL